MNPSKRFRAALLIALICLAPAFVVYPQATGQAASEWKLVWADEFDGKEIDRKKWDFDLGNGFFNYEANTWIGGWGNGELQYYTREPDNAFIKDGMLHISAVKESHDGFGYTSAKLKTRKRDGSSLFAKKYGKFEIRRPAADRQGNLARALDVASRREIRRLGGVRRDRHPGGQGA